MHLLFFFFNDTATTEIYTLSLHDALPISKFVDKTLAASRKVCPELTEGDLQCRDERSRASVPFSQAEPTRSEEHTSELQSHSDLVCRLLLEKKKNTCP